MEKKQFKLKSFINESIMVGDYVRLIDGSGLSVDGYDEDVYIVYGYPDITMSEKKLSEISFKVEKTGIKEAGVLGVLEHVYVQDIELSIDGNVNTFRTCSGFVRLTNPPLITT